MNTFRPPEEYSPLAVDELVEVEVAMCCLGLEVGRCAFGQLQSRDPIEAYSYQLIQVSTLAAQQGGQVHDEAEGQQGAGSSALVALRSGEPGKLHEGRKKP